MLLATTRRGACAVDHHAGGLAGVVGIGMMIGHVVRATDLVEKSRERGLTLPGDARPDDRKAVHRPAPAMMAVSGCWVSPPATSPLACGTMVDGGGFIAKP